MCTIATTKSCSWFMVDLPLTPALNLRDTVLAFIFLLLSALEVFLTPQHYMYNNNNKADNSRRACVQAGEHTQGQVCRAPGGPEHALLLCGGGASEPG